MLLTHTFHDPQVNLTLELFLWMLREFFGERLVSVALYGSIVFDDLAPGYGDLDFLAVVDDDLSDEVCRGLIELRRPLCSGVYGILAEMIEGAFLPRRMLNPAYGGRAFWWGTTGERPWEHNQLGWLVLHVIRERGIVIWGEDIRREISEATREDLIREVWDASEGIHAGGDGLHAGDGLLTAARLLLWLREGRLSSKSEAADWGYAHAEGDWAKVLPRAKQIRLNPALGGCPGVKRWLRTLAEPTREACEELRRELGRGDVETRRS